VAQNAVTARTAAVIVFLLLLLLVQLVFIRSVILEVLAKMLLQSTGYWLDHLQS
jgi:hypothetical protein